jgi:23S rRNA (guanosine2251-2'-O)-methyltransferase
MEMEVLYGVHPVEEALRSGARSLDHVMIARERREDQKMLRIVEACRNAGIRVRFENREALDRLARNDTHQGIVAVARERKFAGIQDLLAKHGQYRFLLALDGIEDPHNLGALLRTAEGAGVDGVVLPERRSAPITATVAKASAGASEHIRIARVTNLVRALEELKANNIWCVGLDERGSVDYDQFDFRLDCALVLGREGEGLHDLVRRTCDHLVRIPMAGQVASLNVSVAGAIVMYEAARQRRTLNLPQKIATPKKAQRGLGS